MTMNVVLNPPGSVSFSPCMTSIFDARYTGFFENSSMFIFALSRGEFLNDSGEFLKILSSDLHVLTN